MAQVKLEMLGLREDEVCQATIIKGEQKYGKEKGTPFLSFFVAFKSLATGAEENGNHSIMNSKKYLIKQFFELTKVPHVIEGDMITFDDEHFKGAKFFCTVKSDNYGWKVSKLVPEDKLSNYTEEPIASEDDPFSGRNPFAKEEE